MSRAAADLPEDAETLKAMLLAARAEIVELARQTRTLEAAKADAQGADGTAPRPPEGARAGLAHGLRSEALDPDQRAFAFEEIETGLSAIEGALEAAAPKPPARKPRPRKALPAHLPRVEVVIEPEEAPCACGSHERVKIGEDVADRLDVIPATFLRLVTRRPKYACPACREGVVQAPAPARLIEAGLPTEALLAQVAVSKYADGLPLYRQEAIHAREGVELGRSLMVGWMGRVGFHLEPLADRVLHHVRAGPRIFADETTLPTLAPGRGKTKTAWLWT